MNKIKRIRDVMLKNGWFDSSGGYVQFDGQYGSTGKGLLASVIAEAVGDQIDMVATNAGPNSGHTAYCPLSGEKIVTQQIPVATAVMARAGRSHECYLNGGAVIEKSILNAEIVNNVTMPPANVRLQIHCDAAVIHPEHQGDHASHIASTGKGVGPAMANKLSRKTSAVYGDSPFAVTGAQVKMAGKKVFVETAQGWSLGINSGFYPYVTTRECSVAQAVADMGRAPSWCKKSIVSIRTYPIRVSNHPKGGSSGGHYPDQRETSFEELGQPEELTTVTQRVRRIFTWSDKQFVEMLEANEPDAIFVNFLNYLTDDTERKQFINNLMALYITALGRHPEFILGGYGPLNSDVEVEYARV
jgi:adenylosuccinate synthase